MKNFIMIMSLLITIGCVEEGSDEPELFYETTASVRILNSYSKAPWVEVNGVELPTGAAIRSELAANGGNTIEVHIDGELHEVYAHFPLRDRDVIVLRHTTSDVGVVAELVTPANLEARCAIYKTWEDAWAFSSICR